MGWLRAGVSCRFPLLLLVVCPLRRVVFLLVVSLLALPLLLPPPSSRPYSFSHPYFLLSRPSASSSSSCSRPSSFFDAVSPFTVVNSMSLRPSGRVQMSVRGIGRWIAKTNHDKCRGSYFVTHHWSLPLHGFPMSSSLPGSTVERG
jgi:hypothetical protein